MSNDYQQILEDKMKLINEIWRDDNYFKNEFLDTEFGKIVKEIKVVEESILVKNRHIYSWTKDFFIDLQRHYAYLRSQLPQHIRNCVDELIDLFGAYITMIDLGAA